jgi:hypothetical protein
MAQSKVKILTNRKIENWPSWDLVYEWENIISYKLEIPFSYNNRLLSKTNSLLHKINFNPLIKFFPRKPYFYFQMSAGLRNQIFNSKKFIIAIIDYHLNPNDRDKFLIAYSKNPFLLISNKEVFDFLLLNNFPKKIYHFPLSISDKYKISENAVFDKQYDLVLFGRQNTVLEAYTKKYADNHPKFSYVYRIIKDGEFNYYTNAEEFLGNINNRQAYIDLMQKSRTAIYGTPGIDGGESRTNGWNQVTPRVLEYIACGCHIIARYPKNSDTDFFDLQKFSPNIETYEDFEQVMDNALATPVDMKMYAEYLEKHYTSKRAELLKEILENEGIKIN